MVPCADVRVDHSITSRHHPGPVIFQTSPDISGGFLKTIKHITTLVFHFFLSEVLISAQHGKQHLTQRRKCKAQYVYLYSGMYLAMTYWDLDSSYIMYVDIVLHGFKSHTCVCRICQTGHKVGDHVDMHLPLEEIRGGPRHSSSWMRWRKLSTAMSRRNLSGARL